MTAVQPETRNQKPGTAVRAKRQIVIVGSAHSGKTVLSSALRERLNCTIAETGYHVRDGLAALLAHSTNELSIDWHRRDLEKTPKAALRPHLIAIGDAAVFKDPGAWMRKCSGARIIVGCRRAVEWEAYLRECGKTGRPRPLLVLVTRPFADVAHDRFDAAYFAEQCDLKVPNKDDPAELLWWVNEIVARL